MISTTTATTTTLFFSINTNINKIKVNSIKHSPFKIKNIIFKFNNNKKEKLFLSTIKKNKKVKKKNKKDIKWECLPINKSETFCTLGLTGSSKRSTFPDAAATKFYGAEYSEARAL